MHRRKAEALPKHEGILALLTEELGSDLSLPSPALLSPLCPSNGRGHLSHCDQGSEHLLRKPEPNNH